MNNDTQMDLSQLNFEEALRNLEAIVKTLEEGSASLEEALALYERGMILKKHCEGKLQAATLKVEEILLSGTDAIKTQPLRDIAS